MTSKKQPKQHALTSQHKPLVARTRFELTETNQSALEKVIILLRTQTRHDFSSYKKNTIYRRIERRIYLRHWLLKHDFTNDMVLLRQ